MAQQHVALQLGDQPGSHLVVTLVEKSKLDELEQALREQVEKAKLPVIRIGQILDVSSEVARAALHDHKVTLQRQNGYYGTSHLTCRGLPNQVPVYIVQPC